jgi:hypothetical protein
VLTAINKVGRTRAKAKVNVDPRPTPQILSFALDPPRIPVGKGKSSTLHWKTTNAEVVTLDGREVDPSGSEVVHPETPTIYELVATDNKGQKVRQISELVVWLREKWECVLNLHQGDTDTLKFIHEDSTIKEDRTEGYAKYEIRDGYWSEKEIHFTRVLSLTSHQPFKGTVTYVDRDNVTMKGQFGDQYAGEWDAKCKLKWERIKEE